MKESLDCCIGVPEYFLVAVQPVSCVVMVANTPDRCGRGAPHRVRLARYLDCRRPAASLAEQYVEFAIVLEIEQGDAPSNDLGIMELDAHAFIEHAQPANRASSSAALRR